ncbi:hypothetical protein D9B96_01540 [Corynebacterium diphtheriae]|nr:hypothetical protein D9B96_01540 [Corynebacterium diphtheriae]
MKKTDAWLVFNERHVLHGFGKRSHKQAIAKAQAEWDAYQLRFDAEVNTMDMKAVEAEGECPIVCVRGAWFTSSPRIGRGKPRLVG